MHTHGLTHRGSSSTTTKSNILLPSLRKKQAHVMVPALRPSTRVSGVTETDWFQDGGLSGPQSHCFQNSHEANSGVLPRGTDWFSPRERLGGGQIGSQKEPDTWGRGKRAVYVQHSENVQATNNTNSSRRTFWLQTIRRVVRVKHRVFGPAANIVAHENQRRSTLVPGEPVMQNTLCKGDQFAHTVVSWRPIPKKASGTWRLRSRKPEALGFQQPVSRAVPGDQKERKLDGS